MHYGQLATSGVAFSVLGVAIGQAWLVALTLSVVVAAALVIRRGFRRGRTPRDR